MSNHTKQEIEAFQKEVCAKCGSEPICLYDPERCMPVKPEIASTKVTYFVMAFVVNDNGKKLIRSEIVKDDEKKAIALANEWRKEFQSWTNDKIEIYVSEHMEIDKEVLNWSKQDNS